MDKACGSSIPLEDERPLLKPLRDALHRVARKLNDRNWNDVLKTTDDFVVIATDYGDYWFTEDLKASVRPEQLKILEKRGLI